MTDGQQVEGALNQSEARFRSYFELGLIGMASTSPTKGILRLTTSCVKSWDMRGLNFCRRTWPEITHPDDLPADELQFNRVMAGEIDGYTLDKRWIRKDGAIIDSLMAAKCLRRADGSVDYFVGLVLDTTERKRAEAALRRSEAYLAEGQTNQPYGQLGSEFSSERGLLVAGNVSHLRSRSCQNQTFSRKGF